ncbi:DUF2852 domain-containing protein [Pseudovibrio exalbescens]|uniref:DUF2852 domain-containing protein n=1 Tax=Pseudovibrio exalbescens TaxID=197461 RepID=A0A1U7JIH8_9HYPH|nr:DUF2852 domain-containing protein [Pseudovibrio exalbescens]OKL44553.1 hypothetical protein A3843_09240 [Pseudovibrio exalbescens]
MTHQGVIRPAWTPATIALMVLGFVVFWPLGLAMLAYILWGDKFDDFKRQAKDTWRQGPLKDAVNTMSGYAPTGNVAFDEYREAELKRLEEERRKLDAMRNDFDNYMKELRRARDKEEFDRFMAARGGRPAGDASGSTA